MSLSGCISRCSSQLLLQYYSCISGNILSVMMIVERPFWWTDACHSLEAFFKARQHGSKTSCPYLENVPEPGRLIFSESCSKLDAWFIFSMTLGPDTITMAPGGKQAIHMSLFLTPFASLIPRLSTEHQLVCFFLYHFSTLYLLMIMVSIHPEPYGARWACRCLQPIQDHEDWGGHVVLICIGHAEVNLWLSFTCQGPVRIQIGLWMSANLGPWGLKRAFGCLPPAWAVCVTFNVIGSRSLEIFFVK